MRTILTIAASLALALALTASLAGTACAEGSVVHVVQRGENLFRIALRYGVTVNALMAANGLSNASRVYVGQRLVIPTGGESSNSSPSPSPAGVHVVQRGENLFRIALRYGLTFRTLAAANGIANPSRIYAGQRLVIPGRGDAPALPAQPAPAGRSYTVRRGDTLSAIARRYGISTWTLAQANGIRNPSFIYVGQVLRIPQGGSPVAPAP
jgi:putative chitinase